MIFFKTNKNKILLISATVVLIVIMMLTSYGKEKAGIVSNTFGTVLSPFQSVADYIAGSFNYGADRGKYESENKVLKQQLATARQSLATQNTLAAENAKLRAMLELKKNSLNMELVAADVVAGDFANWSNSFRINKGISKGIKKNDAVICENGLVGYVSEVGRNWAQVVTIGDLSSSVSAIIERTGEYCLIQGDISLYEKNLCSMKYTSPDTVLSVGDTVVTSGEGGIYPEGIQIGKVVEITENVNSVSRSATIEPFVDFSKVKTVLVVTNYNENLITPEEE